MDKKLTAVLFIVAIGFIYSCGSKSTITANASNVIQDDYPFVESLEPSRAEKVMNALLEVYPDQIEKVEFRNDDWAVLIRGTWYHYSGGRLLPESQIENSARFRTYQFYDYPVDLPVWQECTPEEAERFRNWTTNRRQTQIQRSNFFLDAIWHVSTQADMERQLERMTLFGKPIRIHKFLKEKILSIESQVLDIAKTDTQVQAWINSIHTLDTYNWRNIADTQSRSYHSYGIALDILPRSLGNKQTYWLWTTQIREDWWNVPYSERYHPPAAVVKTFEAQGFIWGGKWSLYDTMHFEYRPEILLLNGILPKK